MKSPDPAAGSAGDRPVPPDSASRAPTGALWLALIALIAALLVALYAYRQIEGIKRESAQRLTDAQRVAAQAADVATRADAEARAARRQSEAVEARLAEEQGQREALEQLYADLTRGHDEALLVEVERLITMAAQELQVGGNVSTALAALQTADSRLARADMARFVPLRRGLAADIERLKVAPTVDTTGIALKLDQIVRTIEQWPLLADTGTTSLPAASTMTTTPDGSAAAAAEPVPVTWWERAVAALRRELSEHRDLIRIRRVDTPEALWLNTQQQQLVRQQVQLRLLAARHALLARNDRLFRNELVEAQALIHRFVDTRDPRAAAALGQLRQLAATPLSVEAPQIGETLAAVRAVRSPKGR